MPPPKTTTSHSFTYEPQTTKYPQTVGTGVRSQATGLSKKQTPRTYLPTTQRPRAIFCLPQGGEGGPVAVDEDAVFCSSYHAAQTTGLRVMGMSVQMGLFPGDHTGSPLQMYWVRSAKKYRTDHGIAAIPHRGGACVSRLRSIRTRTPRCTTHGIYSNLVGTGVPDCPKTTASHTITHSAQTTVATGSPYAVPPGARRVPNVYKLGIDKKEIILYNER